MRGRGEVSGTSESLRKSIRNAMNPNNYKEYILSEDWNLKRRNAFKLFGRRCQICGTTKKIHVHHKTYINFKNEDVENDLAVLCVPHHTKYHKKYKFASIKTTNLFISEEKYKLIQNKKKTFIPPRSRIIKISKTKIHTPSKMKPVELLSL